MRALITLLAFVAFPASALAHYPHHGHILHYPPRPPIFHHPKPAIPKPSTPAPAPPPTSAPAKPAEQAPPKHHGGSWKGVTHGLYVNGVCNIVGHIGGFIVVGVTQNRSRTDKEIEFVPAACSLIGLPFWFDRWKDRKPQLAPDFIDYQKHNQVN